MIGSYATKESDNEAMQRIGNATNPKARVFQEHIRNQIKSTLIRAGYHPSSLELDDIERNIAVLDHTRTVCQILSRRPMVTITKERSWCQSPSTMKPIILTP